MEKQNRVVEILASKNIRPSYTRIKIYEYIYKDKIHPNVDIIYKDLQEEIPTLSKTTIYNTLKLFIEKGLARTVNIYDNEMIYEAIRDEHGHFKCNKCKTIYDIPIKLDIKLPYEMKGSIIDEQHLMITGICNKCR